VVEAFALTKRFADFWALQGISLKVGPGEILALLGPNGAGKTTTIRILGAVLRPTSGRATVCGRDVVTDGPAVRSLVGVLTEFPGLYDRMSTRSYLEFFGELHRVPGPVLRQRVSDLLDCFGLGEVAERRLGTLSRGVRQKVALVRALVHDPRVLFLDEPTSAMDPAGARQVREFIAGLRRADRAIIICTHNLAEAEFLADRIAVISRGRILADGRPAELKRTFAGPPLFELRFTGPPDAAREALNGDVRVVDLGPDYIRYRSEDPGYNPRLVERLVGLGVGVLSLTEVSPSLEEVYLRIVGGEGSS
jgi:ABC-2 type transport system ATP-binding protein